MRDYATDRTVLTLATGNTVFVDMAVNLARSFHYWSNWRSRSSNIRFVLATDLPDALPDSLPETIDIRALRPGEFGEGFSPKLHLDRLACTPATLFLDADCLLLGPLDDVFDRFAGRSVSVVGGDIATGEWFGDVASVCRRFGVPSLPKFNGGLYYLERGPEASAIFDTARLLEPQYDSLGLVRLRGRPNDELLIAVSMAVNGASGIADDGSILAEPLNFASGMEVDVLRGRAVLLNTPGHARYNAQWPLRRAQPRIVHFLGSHADHAPYTAEARKLELVLAARRPEWCARLDATVRYSWPDAALSWAKKTLRPAFHAAFGTRPVAISNRL